VSDPYRDERESLRAEVARLQRDLARSRRRPPVVVLLAGLLGHLALRLALHDWLNEADDRVFYGALGVSLLPLAIAVYLVARGPRKDEP
jgi:hypothetical protein